MKMELLDVTGLRRQQVVLHMAKKAVYMRQGDVLEVVGDCPSLEKVIQDWCTRLGREWLAVRREKGERTTVWVEV